MCRISTRHPVIFVVVLLAARLAAAAPSGLVLMSTDYGSGDGGSTVTIRGQGLVTSGVTRVTFGGEDASGVLVSDLGGGNFSVSCTTPPHPGGLCDITVTNPDLSSATIPYAYVFVPTSFESQGDTVLLPCTGPTAGGTTVFLVGGPAGIPLQALEPSLGGAPLSNIREYVVPGCIPLYSGVTSAHAQGLTSLFLLGAEFFPNVFFYSNATAPIPVSCAPTHDVTSGGATVFVHAGNLPSTGTPQVTFGGVAATNIAVNPDFGGWLSCTAPPHAQGTVSIVVTNPDMQSGTLTNGFTYDALTQPVPSSVSPNQGLTPGGGSVTISGTGFTTAGTTRVTFGGVDATFVYVSSSGTSISCTTPPHAAGAVDVVVTNPGGLTGSILNGFTYLTPPTPNPTSISPGQGLAFGGDWVDISGTGFTPLGTTQVTFGGVLATGVAVQDIGGGNYRVHCQTPAHAAGLVNVVVTGPGGMTGTLTNGYEYLTPPPPAPTSASPSQGRTVNATQVTIGGTGFTQQGTTHVTFGGVNATGVSVQDMGGGSLAVRCNTPAHAAGLVDVVVTNPDGQSGTLTNCFEYTTAPPPSVSSVGTTSGSTVGGLSLYVYGSNLGTATGTRVLFGGVDASVLTLAASSVRCITPPHAAGVVDVTVINSDGQSATLASSFSYQEPGAPNPTGVSPNLGYVAGGDSVTISGSNFTQTGTTQVMFGGVAATSVSVNDIGSGNFNITCTTPPHAAGAVNVTVINPDGRSGTRISGFTYVQPPTPAPISISPTQGLTIGGAWVTINGTGFTQMGTTRVTFGGVDATGVTVYNTGYGSMYIGCNTPPHAAGVVDVTVIGPGNVSGTLVGGFEYLSPPTPNPTSITPNTGSVSGYTSVVIAGTGFIPQGVTHVTFGGVNATSVWVQNMGGGIYRINCQTPPHAAGVVDVTVIGPGDLTGTLAGGYEYLPLPPPVPIFISPSSGLSTGGTSINITGTGFALSGTTRVTFGGVEATNVHVYNAGYGSLYVNCTTPSHAPGPVDIVVINPDGQSGTLAHGFTYTPAPAPHPTSISPIQGLSTGGMPVTVFGTGFTGSGTTRVTFGGVDATEVHIYSAGYGTLYINCVAPAHAPGAVNVVVINPDGQSGTLTNGFTYIPAPAPNPSGITPTEGSSTGGTSVTITGTGFTQSGTTRVTFGGVDATDVAAYSAGYGSTYITCRTPAHAVGAVDVVVINSDGQSGTLADGFTYTPPPPPNPMSISPDSGLVAGGTPVAISGTDFADAGVRVLFDELEATNVEVLGNTVVCLTPAHAAGVVDVTVINPDDQSATLYDAFTYLAPGNSIVFVDVDNVSGVEDGTTWATAFSSIQEGIAAVVASGQPGEVWVAEGIYTTTTATVVVDMQPFCDVYGGFAGTETQRDQRDLSLHSCVIDGQNVNACVWGADNARIDGFTVTGGNGPLRAGTSSVWYSVFLGGLGIGSDLLHSVAVDSSDVSPVIANCDFAGNTGWISIVAILTESGGVSSPLITGCTFTGYTDDGAAVYSASMNHMAMRPRIDACTFIANSSGIANIAYVDGNCSAIVTRCVFDSNTTAVAELGFLGGVSTSRFENCVISEHPNTKVWLYCFTPDSQVSPVFTNCTFAGNTGTRPIIYAPEPCEAALRNCIVWDNTVPLFSGGMSTSVSYSDIQGGYFGEGNLNVDPLFNGETYKIRGESPCANAGTLVGAPAVDLRGVPRPQFGGVDMGAYECSVRATFSAQHRLVSAPGEDIYFLDTSDSLLSPINSWAWDFGDLSTSTVSAPVHSYASVGAYTVTLDVASADDAGSFSRAREVREGSHMEVLEEPKGGWVLLGDPYSMTMRVQGGFGPVDFQWKKDGHEIPVKAQTSTHTIDAVTAEDAGVYTCEVSDDYDTIASDPAELKVASGLPATGSVGAFVLASLLAVFSTGHYLRRRIDK